MRKSFRFVIPSMSPSKDIASNPLMSGAISRWLWRMYIQRLTRAGRWFLLPTLAFAVYGGASLQMPGYVAYTYAMALWVVAAAAAAWMRPRVMMRVRHVDRIEVDQALPVDIDVTNSGTRMAIDLFVIPHRLPPAIDAVEDEGSPLPDLAPGQSARARVELRCRRRGVHPLRGFRVESDYPFGLLRAPRVFARDERLVVYPRFTRLSSLQLPSGRKHHPGGVALASQIGESFEYLGNREYRQGDNVRDIDWRATARLNRPIVREYREEYFMRVAVILDTHVPAGAVRDRHESFERAVSLAAAVSDFMARQDYLVDLFAAGPNLYHLTAGRSLAYLDQILDILACVEQSPTEPFALIAPQLAEYLSRITTIICVMLDWDQTRQQFVQSLLGQGSGVKLIIASEGPLAQDPRAETDRLGTVPIIGKAEFAAGVDQL